MHGTFVSVLEAVQSPLGLMLTPVTVLKHCLTLSAGIFLSALLARDGRLEMYLDLILTANVVVNLKVSLTDANSM